MKLLRLSVALFLFLGCSAGSGNPTTSTGGAGGGGPAGAAGSGGSGPGVGGGSGSGGAVGSGGNSVGVGGLGGSSGSGGSAGSAGAGVGGSGGPGGASAGSGGRGGATGGSSGGGAGASGRGGASAGTGGVAGSGGTGGGSARYMCPAGPFTAPNPSSITLTKVAGVPPFDSFNNNGNNFGNIEGAVWFGDALYVSEIGGGNNPPPSRILRVPTTGTPSVAYAPSGANPGTNGLAIDEKGGLIGASHGVGGIVSLNLTNMTSSTIVGTFALNATDTPTRFDSPNDLTVRSDGTIYFTDPDYQAPSPRPQSATRVYRLPPGATKPVVVDAGRSQPNGITLSIDEMTLYLTTGDGIYRYAVNADGSTGTASRLIDQSVVPSGDGMAIDCRGDLYIASQQRVIVVNPSGTPTSLGSISLTSVSSVTNVAFGGANHQTLYVTGQGTGMGGSAMGLYRADMPLPGMPF
jgi:gluconolactonase